MKALALLLSFAAQEDEALARFRKEYATPKPEDRAAAVKTLGATHGLRTLALLGDILGRDPAPEVRVEAARAVAAFQEMAPKAVSVLAAGISANKDETVLAQILKSLGELKDESAAPVVHRHFAARETAVAEAAVEAAGAIRSRSSVEPLIDLLFKCESESKGAGNSSGMNMPGSAKRDKETRERAKKVKSASLRAIESITREKFTLARDWSEWWRKNAATFKVEK